MNTQKITTEYRMAKWSEVIQRRLESGKTIKDFCIDEGISKHQYFYWQRKLRNAACTGLAVTGDSGSVVPAGWMQLETRNEQYTSEGLVIEIKGCHLNVHANTDPELLKKVCRTLVSL